MSRALAATGAALLLASACSAAGVTEGDRAPAGTTAWVLVWADEFDRDGPPDSTRWGYDVGGHGWGNQELQFYTEHRPENARVEEGRLIIEAHPEAWEGSDFTSARLVSRGKGDWTYGRFEARARLPSGRGTWPAIWMLPTERRYGEAYWPDNGEIDIMEHVGWDPDVVHASVHTRAYHHSIGTQRTARTHLPTARSEFHVYAVEWTPEAIHASIDGERFFTFPNERLSHAGADYRQWPFDAPFHLVLNLAVGGTWGGAQGVDPAIWPQRLEIDYVRVYQRADPVGAAAELGPADLSAPAPPRDRPGLASAAPSMPPQ